MTVAPIIKGYCPGALRPMMSGDGLVVRIRPFHGRINSAQARAIAHLAQRHGNGMMDLSARGNIQLRGVTQEQMAPLIEGLSQLSLIDEDVERESRRNIMVTPFWDEGSQTDALVSALNDALRSENGLEIPGKFGFAVDTDTTCVLQSASADVRLERDTKSDLILVADGCPRGKAVTFETAVHEVLALTRWFVLARQGQTRMARLLRDGMALPEGFDVPRQPRHQTPKPGMTPHGALVGLAFGQLTVDTLSRLADLGPLRMTPWRMILIEGARDQPDLPDLITDKDDPLLRVHACTGAPRCTQGLAQTRPLARQLVSHLQGTPVLHVSGCAKGCAHPTPAALTVTATPTGLNLIRDGCAGDLPQHVDLTLQDLIKAL